MNICFLSPLVPSVAYGHRPHGFLEHLSNAGHRITVHCINDPGPVPDALDLLKSKGIRTCPINLPKPFRWMHCLYGWPGERPLRVCHCRSSKLTQQLLEDLRNGDYDILHVDRFRLAEYARAARDVFHGPIVVDFPDALSLYYERAVTKPVSPFKGIIDRREHRVMRRYEEKVLGWGLESVVCSEIDKRRLVETVPGAKVHVVPNMVDVRQFRPRGDFAGPVDLTFSGTLYYTPNIDALLWFRREILKQIDREDLRINVLGFGATSELDSVRSDSRFRFHGYVENMAEHLLRKDIFICPIRIGAGVRFKILEAFAAGMAVVSTTLGVEGIPCEPGEHLLVADSAGEFAENIIRLLENPDEKERIGSRARAFAVEHYSIEAAGRKLEGIYEGALVR